jgi:hypothetical protein
MSMKHFTFVEFSQGAHGDRQEIDIRNEEHLRKLLKRVQAMEPHFIDLVSAQGGALTIGVGGPLGCAFYISASGDPPYFSTRGPWKDREEEFVVFNVGGTAMEYPLSICLPSEEIIEIALHFFRYNTLYDRVKWEED